MEDDSDENAPPFSRPASPITSEGLARPTVDADAAHIDEVAEAAARCEALTSADQVDKDTALQILKLYHSLETMRHATVVEKEKVEERMRNELAMTRLTHANTETLRKATTDIAALQTQVVGIGDRMQMIVRRVEELEHKLLSNTITKKR